MVPVFVRLPAVLKVAPLVTVKTPLVLPRLAAETKDAPAPSSVMLPALLVRLALRVSVAPAWASHEPPVSELPDTWLTPLLRLSVPDAAATTPALLTLTWTAVVP